MDLGAQYVFEDTSVTPLEIKWPFKSMATQYCDTGKSQIYDSSGMRLDDEMTGIVDAASKYAVMASIMCTDKNNSVSSLKEKA